MPDRRHYFDHNATTPVDPRVLEAMLPCLRDVFGNSSSIHSFGREARKMAEEARRKVADLLGREPREIVFTGGGTEADNLAILGATRAAKREKKHLVTSAIEHPAVLAACERLRAEGVETTIVPVGSDGVVSPDEVRAALRPETVLVSVMHANNELGTVQPIAEIARIAREAGALMHSDGVQACGKIATRIDDLGVDLYSLSAHKIYGPKGAGALFVRRGVDVEPTQYGGGQERGRRPGTQNTAGVVGLGAAAELARANLAAESRRLAALRDRLENQVLDSIADCWINGRRGPRTPNTTNIGFEGVEGEPLLIALDLKGFAVSSGAACSSGAVEPSPVLTAIGLSKSRARSCLRFSLGAATDEAAVDELAAALKTITARLRLLAPTAAG